MAFKNATQDFVPIKEVRDGIIISKDNSLKALVMVSSFNFSLKSVDEQEAVILQFQNFLNSLDFSLQIYIQSRRLDIRPYIAMMQDRRKSQTNDLIKIQTKEYIEFIQNFTSSVNIMSKNFFVVVSYTPTIVKANIFGTKQKTASENEMDQFEENKTQLEQRVNIVSQGLSSVGLRTVKLGTEEVVELLYKIFNPGESEKPIQMN